jgi:hypothetical protein
MTRRGANRTSYVCRLWRRLRVSQNGGVAVSRVAIAPTPAQAAKEGLIILEAMVEVVEVGHMPMSRMTAARHAATAAASHGDGACAYHCKSDQCDESFAWHCSSSLKLRSDNPYKHSIKAQRALRVIGPNTPLPDRLMSWKSRLRR